MPVLYHLIQKHLRHNPLEKNRIFHSIVLDQKAAIIVRLPGNQEQIKVIDVDNATLWETITNYRISLEMFKSVDIWIDRFDTHVRLPPSVSVDKTFF